MNQLVGIEAIEKDGNGVGVLGDDPREALPDGRVAEAPHRVATAVLGLL